MEVLEGLRWFKSSYSPGGDAGGCVEVAHLPNGGMAIRDTKDRDGGVQQYSPDEWKPFIEGAKAGDFDLP